MRSDGLSLKTTGRPTHWNKDAKPFTWTAEPDEIVAKVQLIESGFGPVLPSLA
jgi:hypothetical protein